MSDIMADTKYLATQGEAELLMSSAPESSQLLHFTGVR
jgi:hypothetical protein